jgi:hypothetical protein
MKMDNSKGKVYYGMHFYPGVARYEEAEKEPLTVFINENTIRNMGPSFEACPVFVEHVDGVDDDLNEVRKEADGWVVESFFNQADGKTWAKFVICSDRGLEAIKRGYKLSNCYKPMLANTSGQWNGVPYQQEVTGGEFEHLAIVVNPRYEESVIMTPDEFKKYNSECAEQIKRLANSKDKKGATIMNLFKRQKIENAPSLEEMFVTGEKSKKEYSVKKAVEEYDKFLNMNGYANGDHMVKVGDKDEMSVNDLDKKHLEMKNEWDEEKKKNAETEDGGEPGGDDEDMENEAIEGKDLGGDRGGDKSLDNEDDEDDEDGKDKETKADDKKKNELEIAAAKKVLAREKARKLKNANLQNSEDEEVPSIMLAQDKVARGKALYGSGN